MESQKILAGTYIFLKEKFRLTDSDFMRKNNILLSVPKCRFDASASYPGQWKETYEWSEPLPHRVNHVAWEAKIGLFLIGGIYSPSTTMFLPKGGVPQFGFGLQNPVQ